MVDEDETASTKRIIVGKCNYEDKSEKKIKKRVVSETWSFNNEYYEFEPQLKIIKNIEENKLEHDENSISKIIIQQINKKISSYKQQDILKKKYNAGAFLTFKSVIDKMVECELKCRYCSNGMFVLYDISRETKQWSVDRIDNELGHNISNFHLACLDCNLKRRRRTDEKFLFTKQLNLVKMAPDPA